MEENNNNTDNQQDNNIINTKDVITWIIEGGSEWENNVINKLIEIFLVPKLQLGNAYKN